MWRNLEVICIALPNETSLLLLSYARLLSIHMHKLRGRFKWSLPATVKKWAEHCIKETAPVALQALGEFLTSTWLYFANHATAQCKLLHNLLWVLSNLNRQGMVLSIIFGLLNNLLWVLSNLTRHGMVLSIIFGLLNNLLWVLSNLTRHGMVLSIIFGLLDNLL